MRALAALLLLAACANPETGPRLVEQSTYRVGPPEQREEPQLTMKVFTSREQCIADPDVDADEVDACVPSVDRANGDVRLAFALKDVVTGDARELPLDATDIIASHDGQGNSEQEVTPHHPIRAAQLFVILVDGSSSMKKGDEGSRIIDRVYRALLRPQVREAFFPDSSADTGVVLLRFTNRVTGLDGRAPRIIDNAAEYEREVRTYLYSGGGGFTHLYSAVGESMGTVLEEPEINRWLVIRKGEPTIIAITDGFNNERGADLCGDNADRLGGLLDTIREAQLDGSDAQRQARIFTVGLGRPVFGSFDILRQEGRRPTPESLCGTQAGRMINGDLEEYGIDNASLEWIGHVGKGESYIATDDSRLSQVFLDAAAERYAWYEVRYRVDPWYHRRSFDAGLSVRGFGAGATTRFYPSGWIDAPSPEPIPGSRWTAPVPLRTSLGLIMPLIGGLVLIHFVGPATFNGRRAVTRRARKSKRAPAGPSPKAGPEPSVPPNPPQA